MWQIAASRMHSTVVALKERLIFDLVLPPEDGDAPGEPVLFVRGEGRAAGQVRDCARRNKNARARWSRRQLRMQREARAKPDDQMAVGLT